MSLDISYPYALTMRRRIWDKCIHSFFFGFSYMIAAVFSVHRAQLQGNTRTPGDLSFVFERDVIVRPRSRLYLGLDSYSQAHNLPIFDLGMCLPKYGMGDFHALTRVPHRILKAGLSRKRVPPGN